MNIVNLEGAPPPPPPPPPAYGPVIMLARTD